MSVRPKGRARARNIWRGILSRCNDASSPAYPRYGGRGIRVCEEWLAFDRFYADMGDPPDGKTIERKDNDAGYCPENCTWATAAEQARNRRSNIVIEHEGRSQCLTDWCIEFGIAFKLGRKRLALGWSFIEAMTTPVGSVPQGRTRPDCKLIEHNGECHSLGEWSRRLFGDDRTLRQRLALGWPVSLAIETPKLRRGLKLGIHVIQGATNGQ